jgi:ATP-dependent helicase/nuclease subunit B
LLDAVSGDEIAPDSWLQALIRAAEALAATDETPGDARLWAGEDGSALAEHLSALAEALPLLPPQRCKTLPSLLDAALEGLAVRSRRGLRGREGALHPRVFIWGLLEARLQSAEVFVLGGLTEGVWPPATDPGPWLSRAMRAAIGLPSPEAQIGLAAHDFVSAACSAPTVILSAPRRRGDAPCVPSRWLVRLDALLQGAGTALPAHPAVSWARVIDRPAEAPVPVRPPSPSPPVALRPRRLSVTEIETWLRDPYAIYARHILRLRPLDPIEQSADAADYGRIVHDGMKRFLKRFGTAWPADALAQLTGDMDAALAEAGMRPALAAWWRPRLHRIAAWVAEAERDRRSRGPLAHIATEVDGNWVFDAPAGPFTLRGRADRIERRHDASIAILDYKTGTPPTSADVRSGRAPQLPLEAEMVAQGAFGAALVGHVAELTYWHISGGHDAGRAAPLFRSSEAETQAAIATAREGLLALVAEFDDPGRAYLSQPSPGVAPRFSDYAQLARVAEWAAAEE